MAGDGVGCGNFDAEDFPELPATGLLLIFSLTIGLIARLPVLPLRRQMYMLDTV
jgi:hypothetical protein